MYRFLKRLLYSHKSHYILNHFTLKIHDAEIRLLYNKALGDNFDKLFCTTVIIIVIYTLFRVGIYCSGDLSDTVRLGSSVIILGLLLLWALVRCRWKIQAPKVVFFYALICLTITNLSWRDDLP
jgi:hypothetical protein